MAVGAYQSKPSKTLEYMDLGSDNDWKEETFGDLSIGYHCSVTLKDQYILLIGGVLNGKVSEINWNSKYELWNLT